MNMISEVDTQLSVSVLCLLRQTDGCISLVSLWRSCSRAEQDSWAAGKEKPSVAAWEDWRLRQVEKENDFLCFCHVSLSSFAISILSVSLWLCFFSCGSNISTLSLLHSFICFLFIHRSLYLCVSPACVPLRETHAV